MWMEIRTHIWRSSLDCFLPGMLCTTCEHKIVFLFLAQILWVLQSLCTQILQSFASVTVWRPTVIEIIWCVDTMRVQFGFIFLAVSVSVDNTKPNQCFGSYPRPWCCFIHDCASLCCRSVPFVSGDIDMKHPLLSCQHHSEPCVWSRCSWQIILPK